MKKAALLGGLLATLPFAWVLLVPLVQDDWSFLTRETPWWTAHQAFWRPLSVGLYWKLAALLPFAQSPILHLAGLLAHLLASAAVGAFAASLLAALNDRAPAPREALVAALLWGTEGAHFLPVAWASAAQESLACLFGALALQQWLAACLNTGGRHTPWFLALALLCKEGTIALLPMGFFLWLLIGRRTNRPIAVTCLLLGAAYLVAHPFLAAPPAPDSPYALQLGINIPRNAAALLAFIANVPREALRQVVESHSALAAATCLLLSGLSAAAWGLLAAAARPAWTPRRATILISMAVVALLPYLSLAWNCYPYYTLFATMALSPIFAAGASRPLAVTLLVTAGLASSCYELQSPYPSFIARAEWTQATLNSLPPTISQSRIAARCDDESRWAALGWGTALSAKYALPRNSIRQLTPQAPPREDETEFLLWPTPPK